MQKNLFLQQIKQKVLLADSDAKEILYGSRVRSDTHSESDWEKRHFTPFYKSITKEGIVL